MIGEPANRLQSWNQIYLGNIGLILAEHQLQFRMSTLDTLHCLEKKWKCICIFHDFIQWVSNVFYVNFAA